MGSAGPVGQEPRSRESSRAARRSSKRRLLSAGCWACRGGADSPKSPRRHAQMTLLSRIAMTRIAPEVRWRRGERDSTGAPIRRGGGELGRVEECGQTGRSASRCGRRREMNPAVRVLGEPTQRPNTHPSPPAVAAGTPERGSADRPDRRGFAPQRGPRAGCEKPGYRTAGGHNPRPTGRASGRKPVRE